MEIGRQITASQVWAEENRDKLEPGQGCQLRGGCIQGRTVGGAGEIPCPPVDTDQFELYSEGSRGGGGAERGEWKEKGKGGEKEEERGISQKIDTSSHRPPFLCLSKWRAELTSWALRWRAPGREPVSQPALPVLGIGLSPRTQCFWLLGQKNPGKRGNFLSWILGFGFWGGSFREPGFTFGKLWLFRMWESWPCLDPQAREEGQSGHLGE